MEHKLQPYSVYGCTTDPRPRPAPPPPPPDELVHEFPHSDLSREVRVNYRFDTSSVAFRIENAANGQLEIAPFRNGQTWLPCPTVESFELRIDQADPKRLELLHATSGRTPTGHRFGSPNAAARPLVATIRPLPDPGVPGAVEIYLNAFGVDTGFRLKAAGLRLAAPWTNSSVLGSAERVLHLRPDEVRPRMHQDIHYCVNEKNELGFEIPIPRSEAHRYWLSLRDDTHPNSGVLIGYEGDHPLTRVFLQRDDAGIVTLWREYVYMVNGQPRREVYLIGRLGKGPNSWARPASMTTRLVGRDLDDPAVSNIVALEFRAFGLTTGFLLKAPRLLHRPKWMA